MNLFYNARGTFVADADEIRPQYQPSGNSPSAIFSSSLVRSVGPSIGATIDQIDLIQLNSVGGDKELAQAGEKPGFSLSRGPLQASESAPVFRCPYHLKRPKTLEKNDIWCWRSRCGRPLSDGKRSGKGWKCATGLGRGLDCVLLGVERVSIVGYWGLSMVCYLEQE